MFKRFAVLAVLSLFLIACGDLAEEQVTLQEFEAHYNMVVVDGVNQFDPMELTVQGDHGVISVTNTADEPHGFMIPEFDIRVEVPAGETKNFEIPYASLGVYDVQCHMHAAHQAGQLIIEAP